MSTKVALLLPPIGSEASHWARVRERVAGRIDVLAYDYPGFGDDDRPFDYDAPNLLGRIVDDVLRFASRAPRIDVVGGTSLGGTLAFAIESRLSPPPSALLLVASSGLPVAEVRKDAIRTALRELGRDRFAAEHLGMALETGSPRANAIAALLLAALEVDFREAMRSRERRVAIVFGENDRVFPRTHPPKLAAAIPGAELRMLSGVGHFPPEEDPESVAAILRGLCDGRSP